ncbi:hypothetical protein ACTQ54_01170 [Fundicoccus sp. Sow4_H7]|uniref:hypothetical protein n=1 Tax=Fundicoccus sp. Sow4_H7 TaxID=3438784 RepID=UPI003F8F5C95
MDLYKLALKIATHVHKNQVDKAGVYYINHPMTLSSYLDSEDEKVNALLHDVIEDSKITITT